MASQLHRVFIAAAWSHRSDMFYCVIVSDAINMEEVVFLLLYLDSYLMSTLSLTIKHLNKCSGVFYIILCGFAT